MVGFFAFPLLVQADYSAGDPMLRPARHAVERPSDKPAPDVVRALEEQLSALTGKPQQQPQGVMPLPALKGVVSWKTLGQVKVVQQKGRFVPQFSSEITALDSKEVRLQGFMMPLDMGERQRRFLLTAMPPSCAFCMPGGPDQIVEVQARVPVRHGADPIVLSGRLVLVRDDPMGLFYRLTEAVMVDR
jgi:uncharacterized protein